MMQQLEDPWGSGSLAWGPRTLKGTQGTMVSGILGNPRWLSEHVAFKVIRIPQGGIHKYSGTMLRWHSSFSNSTHWQLMGGWGGRGGDA